MSIDYPPETYHSVVYKKLSEILKRWQETRVEPGEFAGLSTAEQIAVVFAAGEENRYAAPLALFLLLDGFMQHFVLEKRGFEKMIGSTLGAKSLEE